MNRSSFERLYVGNFKAPVSRAGGEHDGARANMLTIGEGEHMSLVTTAAAFKPRRLVRNRHFDTELLRLGERPTHQRHARNARRKAEEIFDTCRGPRLAAERAAVDG